MIEKKKVLIRLIVIFFLFSIFWIQGKMLAASTDAIYIYHMGETDKAVIPVVIAVKIPSDSELKKEFGEFESSEASFFSVNQKTLANLFSALHSFFEKQKDDYKGFSYGTFKFTTSEKGSVNSRIFSPDLTNKIAIKLSKITGKMYEELSGRLIYMSRMNGSK